MQVLLKMLEQHVQRPSGIAASQYEVGPCWGVGPGVRQEMRLAKPFVSG